MVSKARTDHIGLAKVRSCKIYTHTHTGAFTVSTGGTLETLFLFLPLPGVEEETSSRSPPPLTLLEGEVARLRLELADIAGWLNNRLAHGYKNRERNNNATVNLFSINLV